MNKGFFNKITGLEPVAIQVLQQNEKKNYFGGIIMKKTNVMLAALTLAIASITPMAASAANTKISPATTADKGTITMTKSYASHYTFTIPDEPIELNAETNEKDTKVSMVGYLGYGEKLTVTVESSHKWHLHDFYHIENEEEVSYTLKANGKDVTGEDNVVMVFSDTDNNPTEKEGTKAFETKLTFCEFGEAVYAGTYEDTLTFNVMPGKISEEELAARKTTTAEETTTTTTEATTEPEETTTTTTTTTIAE